MDAIFLSDIITHFTCHPADSSYSLFFVAIVLLVFLFLISVINNL